MIGFTYELMKEKDKAHGNRKRYTEFGKLDD